MSYVFKIKFGSTLRRVTVERRFGREPDLTFKELETKIRDMFQVPLLSELVITYTDQDNEVVTMCEDGDLLDACFFQGINPLRLDVRVADVIRNAPGRDSKEKTRELLSGAAQVPGIQRDRPVQHTSNDNLPELVSDSVKQMSSGQKPFVMAAIQESVSEIVDRLLKLPIGTVKTHSHSPVKISGGQTNHQYRSSQSGPVSLGNTDRIFHKGVQCDICGITPMVGPRFKSIRKEDYDLCLSCFTELGNEADYQRIDRPVHRSRNHYYHFPYRSKMMRHHMPRHTPPLKSLSLRGPFGWKHEYIGRSASFLNAKGAGEHYGVKLDARFVRDVSISDGTEVTRGTNFTKIWRLRNIGNFPWPHLTQLVQVGGDILGSEKPVSLELPEEGLPCDEETDASVDLVAPERPGRYVSQWRLMTPSGQKFGQRVWVLIQVVPMDIGSPQGHESLMSDQLVSARDNLVCGKSNEMQESLPVISNSNELNSKLLKLRDRVNLVDDNANVVGSELGGFSLVERPGEKDNLQASGWEHMLDDLEEMGFNDVETNRYLLLKNHGQVKLVVKELLEIHCSAGNKEKSR